MARSTLIVLALAGTAAAAVGLHVTGKVHIGLLDQIGLRSPANAAPAEIAAPASVKPVPEAAALTPAISVVAATRAAFSETVLVAGTLVPREEILVAPEVEGLKVLELLVEEGARVKQGDVLARLANDTLTAQLEQNKAALARNAASIAQARSAIVQARAREKEAIASLDRARPLRQSGVVSDSTFDQREAAQGTAVAQVQVAEEGLKAEQAERARIEAQARELRWRLERSEVKSPAAGLVTRRSARVGALASAQGEPMFRIAANAEIELDGEVSETRLARISAGQTASVTVAGLEPTSAVVRMVMPEVDRMTRVGRVRIGLGSRTDLRIGTFARGEIITGRSNGLSIPASAVLYGSGGPIVKVVGSDAIVRDAAITTGLSDGERVEVITGLNDGDLVVAKAGTFLRPGDRVRPVIGDARVSQGAQAAHIDGVR